ncbi:MAG TPA: 4-(cytidine 5'-diphospho)-2-C-methyl-D-erythritol kinase [Caulobacteraceae bacterium]|nr:4-(cytidine 5'-diphospho)-2-C-methyl-D-erythritol kinase [Caulobacteraceae bacterium]
MTQSPPQAAFAAAKVNVFLHVGPRQPDGYHPVASLIAFADIGDRLSVAHPSAPPLVIEGAFAAGLPDGPDNLVARACAALKPSHPVALVLQKDLPLASGLGGGSADAAAALRLVDACQAAPAGPERLLQIARTLGADVAACLVGRPVIATGRGDALAAAPVLPALDAVLVNPGVAATTAEVYRLFDETKAATSAELPPLPARFHSVRDVAHLVARTRNDLEVAAVRFAPEIGAGLLALRAERETLAARMSGSGSTLFALCEDRAAARRLAGRLAERRPNWWVRPCRLGSAPL